MKFYSLTGAKDADKDILKSQFDNGHQIGIVCVAGDYLFIKKGFKTYYIAYEDTDRIFRRVRSYHVNMCCDQGDLTFEYLIVCKNDKELIEAQLPGEKAAKMLLEEIKAAHPEGVYTAPAKSDEEEAVS
ncbi:MAG: hypothetical protein K5886_07515 [Lachnospiraceae bacterium]|nr:hypothetical protein [Lachnospiraceae bacterium]